MKFRAKLFVIFCILACMITVLAGCGSSKEKTFSVAGFTITLTEAFTEKESETYAAYLESSKSLVTAERFDFSLFEESGYSSDISLQEFAEMIINGNGITTIVQEKEGLVCFAYEKNMEGSDIGYLAVVFRGPDAYWLVHFACSVANYNAQEAQFILWAKTIEV